MRKMNMAAIMVALLLMFVGIVGCKKTPGYIGSYKMTASADMKKQSKEAMVKMGMKEAEADAQVSKMDEEASKITLTIKEDGTFESTMQGKTEKGKYKAEGNVLKMSDEKGEAKDFTYDEKEQTLSADLNGMKMVFKKDAK